MSERYTKLFSLPENLYAETSPVVIAAGALLKDNATGKVLAQLKFRNITGKTVKALRVRIMPLDTVGAPLGEAVSHQYLDLSAGRDDEFGQKSPVTLPDAATRSYSVSVTEAIFADNSLWSATDAPWQVLPAPAYLSSVLRDRELEKQYCLKFGNNCQYNPAEHKDLWYCACGALNTKADVHCHKCHNTLCSFLALDIDALKTERDERLAKEAEAAAKAKAEAEAQAKKTKKLAAIIIPIVAVLVAAALYVTQVIIPASQYKAAEALLDAGEYTAAIEAFEALEDYRDSADRAKEAENAAAYEEAVSLLEAEDYANAIEAFRALGDYKDSDEKRLEAADAKREIDNAASYEEAEELLVDGDFQGAYEIFQSISDYGDVEDRLEDFHYIPLSICYQTNVGSLIEYFLTCDDQGRLLDAERHAYGSKSYTFFFDDTGALIKKETANKSFAYTYTYNDDGTITSRNSDGDIEAIYDEYGNTITWFTTDREPFDMSFRVYDDHHNVTNDGFTNTYEDGRLIFVVHQVNNLIEYTAFNYALLYLPDASVDYDLLWRNIRIICDGDTW